MTAAAGAVLLDEGVELVFADEEDLLAAGELLLVAAGELAFSGAGGTDFSVVTDTLGSEGGGVLSGAASSDVGAGLEASS
jgi:hypothetical protein